MDQTILSMPEKSSLPAVVELADYLAAQREPLLKEWMNEVHKDANIQTSETISTRELRDHIPNMFDDLVEMLRHSDKQSTGRAEDHARVHGHYRLTQGYELSELLREIALARLVFTNHIVAFEERTPAFDSEAERFALRTIHEFFDNLARESVKRFVDEQQAELAHLSAARLRLLRTVSHELRNPINSISLVAQSLPDEQDEACRREAIGRLQRNVAHLTELLNRLLDFSKLIDGTLVVVLAPFDPQEFAHDLQSTYHQLCESRGLEFEASVDPRLGHRLVGDLTKLRQIADNLLSNALKYTATGRVKLRLCLAADDTHWLLVVEDTGRGIAAEAHSSLFHEFYRVPGTEHLPGTGLGLAITRRLVELLGGSIRVDSMPGQGSCFEAKFPRVRESLGPLKSEVCGGA